MVQLLVASPLLTLFVVIALGTLIGSVPIGPLKLGPAGALFVGLAFGALHPELGQGLELVQAIGLALFVYTVGLASGAAFFRDLRKQAPLMVVAVAMLILFAIITLFSSKFFGVSRELSAGMMTGSLTSTPALGAATAAADGSVEPAVGYSIAYPIGVIVTMIFVTVVAKTRKQGKNDPSPESADALKAITVLVTKPMRVDQIPNIASIPGKESGQVRVTYLQRGGEMKVAMPTEQLLLDDRIVIVGIPEAVRKARDSVGIKLSEHIADDRSVVDNRYMILSNPELAGRTVADLHLPLRFGAIISRIRRNDKDLLPNAQTTMQLGDRVRVVARKEQIQAVSQYLGDSEKQITELDVFSMGLGITLGVAVGLFSLSFGETLSVSLGSAAGPLVIGLILGRIRRTGPVIWDIPMSANLIVRQLGLTVFLATVGLASGQAFARMVFTKSGLTVVLLAVTILLIVLLLFYTVGKLMGLSSARLSGAIAGLIGQPAILNHVNSIVDDPRTNAGYAAIFALGIIMKILLAQLVIII